MNRITTSFKANRPLDPYTVHLGVSQSIQIRSKCILCGAEIVKEVPTGTLVDGFMPPYVCDKCKAVWKKLSEDV